MNTASYVYITEKKKINNKNTYIQIPTERKNQSVSKDE